MKEGDPMSYCVNCGVELAPCAAKCPLCECPVVNPMEPGLLDVPSAYPHDRERADNFAQRRFAAVIITIICLFAAGICLLIDLYLTGGLSWSRFAAGAVLLGWIAVCVPLVRFRIGPFRITLIDLLASGAYVFLIERWTEPGMWFVGLALPIFGVIGVAALVTSLLIRKKLLGALDTAALLTFDAGLLTLCLEVLIEGYLGSIVHLSWGWFAFIPCVVCAVMLMVIERKQNVKQALARRFHI